MNKNTILTTTVMFVMVTVMVMEIKKVTPIEDDIGVDVMVMLVVM